MKKVLIILVIGIGLGVLVYGAKNFSSSPGSSVKPDFFKKSSEVKKTMTTLIPEQKADFSKDGSLHLYDENKETATWKLLYDEPGRLALILTLSFNFRSRCDYGGGEQICNEKKFENGKRVHVEGIINGDQLTVLKLKTLNEE